jgi:hypothetical protein
MSSMRVFDRDAKIIAKQRQADVQARGGSVR